MQVITILSSSCGSAAVLIVCEADLYILTLYVSGLVTLPCSIKRYNGSIKHN